MMFKKLLFIPLLLGVMFLSPAHVVAQDPVTVPVTASWQAPTTGSPVVHYVLQVSTNDGGTWVTMAHTEITSVILDLEIHTTYVARVAGVDALSRQGPWSETSDPYTPDLGIPGEPGKPIIVIN